MSKEEFEKLMPKLAKMTHEERKEIWYEEARKKGNPCITEEQKKAALKMPLIDMPKLKLHDWSHGKESNYY